MQLTIFPAKNIRSLIKYCVRHIIIKSKQYVIALANALEVNYFMTTDDETKK